MNHKTNNDMLEISDGKLVKGYHYLLKPPTQFIKKFYGKYITPINYEWYNFLYVVLLAFTINLLSSPNENLLFWGLCISLLIFAVLIHFNNGRAYHAIEKNIQSAIQGKIIRGEVKEPADIEKPREEAYIKHGPWLAFYLSIVIFLLVFALLIYAYLIIIKNTESTDQANKQKKIEQQISIIETTQLDIHQVINSIKEENSITNNNLLKIEADLKSCKDRKAK